MSQREKKKILSAYFAQLWHTNRWVGGEGVFCGDGREKQTNAFPNELRIKFPHRAMLAFHGSISHQFIRPLAANGLWALEFMLFFFIPTTVLLSKRKAATGWARR